jgi:hypothetical protein
MHKIKRISTTTAIATGLLGLTATSAFAHATEFRITGKAYGVVNSVHTTVEACDLAADGLGVRMEYTLRNGYRDAVGDANGSDSGCGKRTVGTSSNPVYSARLCLSNNSCTSYQLS